MCWEVLLRHPEENGVDKQGNKLLETTGSLEEPPVNETGR